MSSNLHRFTVHLKSPYCIVHMISYGPYHTAYIVYDYPSRPVKYTAIKVLLRMSLVRQKFQNILNLD